jgi:hypothetical protein
MATTDAAMWVLATAVDMFGVATVALTSGVEPIMVAWFAVARSAAAVVSTAARFAAAVVSTVAVDTGADTVNECTTKA